MCLSGYIFCLSLCKKLEDYGGEILWKLAQTHERYGFSQQETQILRMISME